MINKTGLHAIRALVSLARLPAGAHGGAAAIAAETDAPPNYLGKLLQRLARQGLVESQKGFGGGFRLKRNPRSIRLLDVIDPIEHVSRRSDCLLGQGRCSDADPCAMHHRWAKLREEYLAMLRETTIADLSSTSQRDRPTGLAADARDARPSGDPPE